MSYPQRVAPYQMWGRGRGEGARIVDVLARADELTIAARRPAQRAPWQTRFADLPAVPRSGITHRVAPIAVPVGGAPINGRHLVRAPWAEPLSAFAGVIVETQLVPDAWVTPRSAAHRAPERPTIPVAVPVAPLPRPYVAIPIRPDPVAALPRSLPLAAPVTTIPVRVVPVAAPRRIAGPASMTALGRVHAGVSATSAAPIEPVMPSPVPTTPPSARRGRLGRAVVFAASVVVSIVAAEAAARIGRR